MPGWIAVHPHAGGENDMLNLLHGKFGRFTPTRVGKTRQAARVVQRENGSPPRGWGKPACLEPGRGW